MPVDQEHIKSVLEKLNRQLPKLANKPQPKNVHQFRTNARRLEAVLEEVAPDIGRNEKKLLKQLARLRRKAGRVRDLDVQVAALRSLKIPHDAGRKAQLLRTLVETRAKREQKLAKALDTETVRELKRRLKRAATDLQIPDNVEPLVLATRMFTRVNHTQSPLTEKILHGYRIAGKRVRYVAELAGDVPEAQPILEKLKVMQDALGSWRDWLLLTETAEKIFSDVPDSALVSALRNVTRAKLRQAMQVVTNTRTSLLSKPAATVRPEGSSEATAMVTRRRPAASSAELPRAASA